MRRGIAFEFQDFTCQYNPSRHKRIALGVRTRPKPHCFFALTLKLLSCVQCGATYKEGEADTCPRCGRDDGILDVHFDLDRARKTLTRENLKSRTRSHWRYRELLPLDEEFCPTEGHLGWTPIIEALLTDQALMDRRRSPHVEPPAGAVREDDAGRAGKLARDDQLGIAE